MTRPSARAAAVHLARRAALDAITAGATELSERLYKATGWPVRALGVGVCPAVFERAVAMHVERTGGNYAKATADGYFDMTITTPAGDIALRVVVKD
jgi:hypothetical protein